MVNKCQQNTIQTANDWATNTQLKSGDEQVLLHYWQLSCFSYCKFNDWSCTRNGGRDCNYEKQNNQSTSHLWLGYSVTVNRKLFGGNYFNFTTRNTSSVTSLSASTRLIGNTLKYSINWERYTDLRFLITPLISSNSSDEYRTIFFQSNTSNKLQNHMVDYPSKIWERVHVCIFVVVCIDWLVVV